MRKKFSVVIIYAFLFSWSIGVLLPVIYMLLSSLKTDGEIMSSPWSLPKGLNFHNFIGAWVGDSGGEITMGHYFINSIIVTSGTLLLLTFVALLCGYALARYPFPGNTGIYNLMIGLMAIPVHALLVPVYSFLEKMNLINSFIGIILVYTAFWLPFSVILMRSYFESVPTSVEEAARIDGCSEWKVFWHVGVPMARGAIATLVIVNVVGIWSELLFSSVLLTTPEVRTLPSGIMQFAGGMYGSSVGLLFASLCIATIPLIIIYFIFQKQIQKGMAVGAVK